MTIAVTDIDGGTLAYAVGAGPDPGSGSLVLDTATGAYTFTPATDYSGPATFTFTANDAPVALTDDVATPTHAPVTIDVRTNDTDVDDPTSTLTVTLISATATPTGQINCTAAGGCTYMPPNGFSGADSFSYQVTDPGGLSSEVTVTITVGSIPGIT